MIAQMICAVWTSPQSSLLAAERDLDAEDALNAPREIVQQEERQSFERHPESQWLSMLPC